MTLVILYSLSSFNQNGITWTKDLKRISTPLSLHKVECADKKSLLPVYHLDWKRKNVNPQHSSSTCYEKIGKFINIPKKTRFIFRYVHKVLQRSIKVYEIQARLLFTHKCVQFTIIYKFYNKYGCLLMWKWRICLSIIDAHLNKKFKELNYIFNLVSFAW